MSRTLRRLARLEAGRATPARSCEAYLLNVIEAGAATEEGPRT